jgi:hypothetical protein
MCLADAEHPELVAGVRSDALEHLRPRADSACRAHSAPSRAPRLASARSRDTSASAVCNRGRSRARTQRSPASRNARSERPELRPLSRCVDRALPRVNDEGEPVVRPDRLHLRHTRHRRGDGLEPAETGRREPELEARVHHQRFAGHDPRPVVSPIANILSRIWYFISTPPGAIGTPS